jgi:hypothetical protein
MAITPTLDAKLLGEMVPGELIRFPAGGAMMLGVVAGCDHLGIASGLVIVLLEDLPDRAAAGGRFLPINEFMMSKTGLSYGREHIVVVHPSAPAAGPSDERFATDGALLVATGARALRTRNLSDDFTDFRADHRHRHLESRSQRPCPPSAVACCRRGLGDQAGDGRVD